LPTFPFGSDFTEVEQRLIPALQLLRDAQRFQLRLPGLLWQGITQPPDAADRECLARLGLDRPTVFAERAYRALVSAAWRGAGRGELVVPYLFLFTGLRFDERRHALGAVFECKGRVEQIALGAHPSDSGV
jgi:hypothetical protein